MATTITTPTWVLKISNDHEFDSDNSRRITAANFFQLFKRFVVGKSGGLTKERQAEKDKLTRKAFSDFKNTPLTKPLEEITMEDLGSSFFALVNFFAELSAPTTSVPIVSLEGKEDDNEISHVQEDSQSEPSCQVEPLAQLYQEPPSQATVPAGATSPGFRREPIFEAVSTPDLVIANQQKVETKNPGLKATKQTQEPQPKAYSPKSKLTPKGQERLLISLPIESKKKLMAIAEARGTTATKLITEFIDSL